MVTHLTIKNQVQGTGTTEESAENVLDEEDWTMIQAGGRCLLAAFH
jgi:hypothetical protein